MDQITTRALQRQIERSARAIAASTHRAAEHAGLRDKAVAELVRRGLSHAEIAAMAGITKARVSQIVKQQREGPRQGCCEQRLPGTR